MTLRNQVILVNEQDEEIGIEEKMPAHRKGLLHRAFSVMLYRYNKENKVEFLLQKRASGKYHCGGLWTNTCCSHPQPGQGLLESAKIRLKEELVDIDVDIINLKKIGSFIYKAEFQNGLTEYEFDHVLVAEYNAAPKFVNPQEISILEWLDLETIKNKYQSNADEFTPWFEQVFTMATSQISPVNS